MPPLPGEPGGVPGGGGTAVLEQPDPPCTAEVSERELTRTPAPGGFCAHILHGGGPVGPLEGTPELTVPAVQWVFLLEVQLMQREQGLNPAVGKKEHPKGQGAGEPSGKKAPLQGGPQHSLAPGRPQVGWGPAQPQPSRSNRLRGAGRCWESALGACSLSPCLQWAPTAGSGHGSKVRVLRWRWGGRLGCSTKMGRGDHCRWVVRREQTAPMSSVDGMQRLWLHVGRLGLDPCGKKRCRRPGRSPCS